MGVVSVAAQECTFQHVHIIRAQNKVFMLVVHPDNRQVLFGCLQEYLVKTNLGVNNSTVISGNKSSVYLPIHNIAQKVAKCQRNTLTH